MSLPIPREGLFETLRSWSGRGQLFNALALVDSDELTDRSWTARDIERRAYRVLFAQLAPMIATWPDSTTRWLDALPAESIRNRAIATSPTSGTIWPETRRLGWPPRSFSVRNKDRVADTLLVTTLRWTLEQVQMVYVEAKSVDSTIDRGIERQIATALSLLNTTPVLDATAEIPSRSDVAAFRAEGKPWNVVVQVTERLRYLSGANLLELAEELIMPDKELQDRVFHLGVLGEILIALRHKGYNVRSIRPLSGGRLGPAYEFMSGVGEKWDLWFEAAGAWSYYKQKSPYGEAAKGVEGAGRALGSDILLIQSPKRALIIECKFSANPTYVARNGYEQVLAYAAEMKGKLATDVQGVVVGPQSVVATVGVAETVVGRVSIIPPSAIRSLAIEFIELDLSTAP